MVGIVQELNQCGIIHRDLKFQNFLVDNNRVVLCDFNGSLIKAQS